MKDIYFEYSPMSNMFEMHQLPEWSFPLIFLIILWVIFWKGTALWHAARANNNTWFIILLIVNTLGILELIYLFLIKKVKIKKLFK